MPQFLIGRPSLLEVYYTDSGNMFSHLRNENGIITLNNKHSSKYSNFFSCFKVWHDSQVEPNKRHSLRPSEPF